MGAAEQLDELVLNDLDHHLPRRDRTDHLLADGAFPYLRDEGPDHRQRDIGLEQRDADLPHRLGDVAFRKGTAPLEAVERSVQSLGQTLKHLTSRQKGLGPQMFGRDPDRSAGIAAAHDGNSAGV